VQLFLEFEVLFDVVHLMGVLSVGERSPRFKSACFDQFSLILVIPTDQNRRKLVKVIDNYEEKCYYVLMNQRIQRHYSAELDRLIKPGRVLVIYGPRRVGKTTLVNNYLKDYQGKVYQSTGENSDLRNILTSQQFSKIVPFFTGYDLVFIDEAQLIPNIGQGLKIMVDQIPNLKIIATGSSSFELANKIGEPLVGRQHILKLHPLSVSELREDLGPAYSIENINNLLIYGSYPEIITSIGIMEKIDSLVQIRDSYLYKDIFALDQIQKPEKIEKLLKLIAFQIGSEVSLNELGQTLEMSKNTVARYLDLLEKTFVLYRLDPYFINSRKAVSRKSKYYFLDLGIRNTVIGNHNSLDTRNDVGQLWENFLVVERLKRQAYQGATYGNNYFWRTNDQKEVDWVEMRDGKLFGYEFKWGVSKKSKNEKSWLNSYPTEALFKQVNRDNYLDFIV